MHKILVKNQTFYVCNRKVIQKTIHSHSFAIGTEEKPIH